MKLNIFDSHTHTDNSPDVPADEPDNPGEEPENPGDVPGDEEVVEAEVFYDEEYMLLNHTYDTSSEIVKTFSFTTKGIEWFFQSVS